MKDLVVSGTRLASTRTWARSCHLSGGVVRVSPGQIHFIERYSEVRCSKLFLGVLALLSLERVMQTRPVVDFDGAYGLAKRYKYL